MTTNFFNLKKIDLIHLPNHFLTSSKLSLNILDVSLTVIVVVFYTLKKYSEIALNGDRSNLNAKILADG
jgi:hypothetical protein